MFGLVSKKRFEKEIEIIKNSFKDNHKSQDNLKVQIDGLKVQLDKLNLDNKLCLLEHRLSDRIDNILIEAIKNKPLMSISPSPNKSKTSQRQVQENRVIQAFRQTKKQIAKEKIALLIKTHSIPSIKALLMQELGISKASFYNYLKELDLSNKSKLVQISP